MGTGKFTVALAERGYSVFAIEPNADMRRWLAITLAPFPNVKIMDDTAKTTTLPEQSVDVITVAHALHWFNSDAFYAECRGIIIHNGLDCWLAYIASQDNYPLPTDPGYDEHIASINAIFDRDSINGL